MKSSFAPARQSQSAVNAETAQQAPAVADNRTEAIQLKEAREMMQDSARTVSQRKAFSEALNNDGGPPPLSGNGLPTDLKNGLENLSGINLGDVKVHYNSARPRQLDAYAYAQGNEIHLGPGQEKHLAHEGWHVVQQKQQRVKPTLQLTKDLALNDDQRLECEADTMGEKSLTAPSARRELKETSTSSHVIQGKFQTKNGNAIKIMC